MGEGGWKLRSLMVLHSTLSSREARKCDAPSSSGDAITQPSPAKVRLKLLKASVKKEELTAAKVSIPWPLTRKALLSQKLGEYDPCLGEHQSLDGEELQKTWQSRGLSW